MKEDYLWDKTGEPDPEIQELEEILGALRYQPKPLELPRDLPTVRQRRNHFPLVAIAASVLLALLAAGVWLRVRTQGESQPNEAKITATPQPVNGNTTVAKNNDEEAKDQQIKKEQKIEHVRKKGLRALPRYTKREREEALAAKQQVMLALRLATEKLSLVHKKTQNPSNQIKNQHRVG